MDDGLYVATKDQYRTCVIIEITVDEIKALYQHVQKMTVDDGPFNTFMWHLNSKTSFLCLKKTPQSNKYTNDNANNGNKAKTTKRKSRKSKSK